MGRPASRRQRNEPPAVSGYDFEAFLHGLFKRLGYRSQLTSMSGDYGADLVLIDPRTRERIVVQAKHYRGNLGLKPVQEVVAARQHYQADACWVVTNSRFTAAAQQLAADNAVVLVDGEQLSYLARKVGLSLERFERGPQRKHRTRWIAAVATILLVGLIAAGMANQAMMG